MAAKQLNIANPGTQDSRKSAAANSTSNSGGNASGIDKRLLQKIIQEIDPRVRLDEDVEEVLLHLANDFIDKSLESAHRSAKKRRSSTIEVQDMKMHMERTLNMTVPGFGKSVEETAKERSAMTDEHLQQLDHFRNKLK